MARFYGPICYEQEQREDEPGVYQPAIMMERNSFGTILRHQRKWNTTNDGTNDDVVLTNRISIVADDYVLDHWPAIRYVKWANACWKVLSVEVSRPRVTLNLGGVWNGNKA